MGDSSTDATSLSSQPAISVGRLVTRNLLVRLLTGFALLPVVLAALFYGGTAFTILVMVVMLVGTLELNLIVTKRHIRPTTVLSVVIVTLIGLMNPLFGGSTPLLWLVVIIGLALLSALSFWTGTPPHRLRDALVTVGGTLYLACAANYSIYLRALPAGLILWMLVFIGAFGMDTFSYLGGRLFGRHHIAPRISPGKTVEGAVIGGLCAIVIALSLLVSTNTLILVTIVITIVMPFTDLAGDLLESYVKRLYAVKDSFIPWLNIMPGHGGVLDRIDGLLMVVLVTMVILTLSGL